MVVAATRVRTQHTTLNHPRLTTRAQQEPLPPRKALVRAHTRACAVCVGAVVAALPVCTAGGGVPLYRQHHALLRTLAGCSQAQQHRAVLQARTVPRPLARSCTTPAALGNGALAGRGEGGVPRFCSHVAQCLATPKDGLRTPRRPRSTDVRRTDGNTFRQTQRGGAGTGHVQGFPHTHLTALRQIRKLSLSKTHCSLVTSQAHKSKGRCAPSATKSV